jgi:hypothetical protein
MCTESADQVAKRQADLEEKSGLELEDERVTIHGKLHGSAHPTAPDGALLVDVGTDELSMTNGWNRKYEISGRKGMVYPRRP